jgi:putative hydrolase of the HAD superfamily
MIKTALVDFGGVIAEEGFLAGLYSIAKQSSIDPEKFFLTVDALIYDTGYLTGAAGEAQFWNAVRERTGISGDDAMLREEIISRFAIRPRMLTLIDGLRKRGVVVAMLSDQTNWLEEIDQRTTLFARFDRIFNSFRIHKSKRDASVFLDVCGELGARPDETLFIDDNVQHINRAKAQGLSVIHFVDVPDFERRLKSFIPDESGNQV